MINSLSLNETGGAIPTVAGTPTDFNGGTPVLLQKLCVDGGVTGGYYAGRLYTQDGRLCVSFSTGARVWLAGLPLTQMGRLCVSTGNPIVFFLQGIPFDAGGRVCLANNPVLAEASE